MNFEQKDHTNDKPSCTFNISGWPQMRLTCDIQNLLTVIASARSASYAEGKRSCLSEIGGCGCRKKGLLLSDKNTSVQLEFISSGVIFSHSFDMFPPIQCNSVPWECSVKEFCYLEGTFF
ncbi:hypothetical protein Ddye_001973 [Dipteronia dyeriana]|uniref:Uncharacterized protein n=1 Tax=Dipteronia dyeriana TaxID=168575 RepID=A0AAE0CU16_9ROSI|nr:hypothetical protein Ddye_001973 [Dipteronia dyeriana]